MTVHKRFSLAGLLLAGVVLLGASGFHYIEDWPWFDGFYMTIVTMTTVGYEETHPLSGAGKVFNSFLIVAAVMAGAFLLATFTQVMVEFELDKFVGRRRMQRELAKLNNHYIICGAGRVGRTVAREFRSHGVPFVFIETNEQSAQWAQNEGMAVVVGSATREEVLHEARIDHAQGLVAAVASDADNLYIVLTARGLKPDLTIVARASEEEALPKFKRAGATHVVSPYHFVGRRIARLFLRPHVLELIDNAFGSERLDMEIEEVPVAEKSALAGKTLADSEIRQKTGVMVLAVKLGDGRMHFNPAPDVVVHPGDCLIAIGAADHLEKLESLANS